MAHPSPRLRRALAALCLAANGLPTAYDAQGHDYWKVPLAEHFEVAAGKATWKNRIEDGSTSWSAPGAF